MHTEPVLLSSESSLEINPEFRDYNGEKKR